jgi:hypothetical protein
MLDEMEAAAAQQGLSELKRAAFEIVTDAMDEAEAGGIEREIVTQATLFAALTDLVTRFGEDPVAEFVRGLAPRVENGEFTLTRVLQ